MAQELTLGLGHVAVVISVELTNESVISNNLIKLILTVVKCTVGLVQHCFTGIAISIHKLFNVSSDGSSANLLHLHQCVVLWELRINRQHVHFRTKYF